MSDSSKAINHSQHEILMFLYPPPAAATAAGLVKKKRPASDQVIMGNLLTFNLIKLPFLSLNYLNINNSIAINQLEKIDN